MGVRNAAAAPPARYHVLVVDDDPPSLRLVRRILQDSEIETSLTDNPDEALKILEQDSTIDVMLTDLHMPMMNGIELIEEARRRFGHRPWLKFVVVTGVSTMESAVQAIRLQAFDYLHKPFSAVQLAQSVQAALAAAEMLRGLPPQSEGEPATSQMAPVDLPNVLGKAWEFMRIKDDVFGAACSTDPAWNMLVELMRLHLHERKVSVTSLCLASKVPVTTALRRLEELVAEGLVLRMSDAADSRRVYVELSQTGHAKMSNYLQRIVRAIAAGNELR